MIDVSSNPNDPLLVSIGKVTGGCLVALGLLFLMAILAIFDPKSRQSLKNFFSRDVSPLGNVIAFGGLFAHPVHLFRDISY